MQLNKSSLIELLAARCSITATEAERIVNTLSQIVYETLAQDGVVNWQGFGRFSVSHREARIGVNPRSPSQKITIPKLNTPKFKAGEQMKAAVRLK